MTKVIEAYVGELCTFEERQLGTELLMGMLVLKSNPCPRLQDKDTRTYILTYIATG